MFRDKITTLCQKIEITLTALSWLVSLLVTFIIVLDVFLRFVFNHPLPATWEISEIFMPYIVFLPFAYTLTIDAHVRVSLIKDKLSARGKLCCEIFTNFISFVLCLAITYWSWGFFWQSFIIKEEILAAVKLPWWVGKMAMPIGMIMFTTRYLLHLLFNLTSKRTVGRPEAERKEM